MESITQIRTYFNLTKERNYECCEDLQKLGIENIVSVFEAFGEASPYEYNTFMLYVGEGNEWYRFEYDMEDNLWFLCYDAEHDTIATLEDEHHQYLEKLILKLNLDKRLDNKQHKKARKI
ncbi:hypothetical protein LA345_23285 [Burkholderia vietnamiensis]|nr:hypothetical protein [Burkholderia vietnamiensis]